MEQGTEGDDTLAAGQDDDPLCPTPSGCWTVMTRRLSNHPIPLPWRCGRRYLRRAGDVSILYDLTSRYDSNTSEIDAGDGDDTMAVDAAIGVDLPEPGGAAITGGEGNDSFEYVLDLQGGDSEVNDEDVISTSFTTIVDFVPGEDTISIDITRAAALEGRNVSEITPDQTKTEDGFANILTLPFAATDNALEAIAQLSIHSAVALTLDDRSPRAKTCSCPPPNPRCVASPAGRARRSPHGRNGHRPDAPRHTSG